MDPTPAAGSLPPRLTTAEFWHELADGLFNLDRGLPWTMRRMLLQPGRLIRDFVVHRDPRIVRPVKWFLVGFSLAALVFGFVDGAGATLEGMEATGGSEALSGRDAAAWWVLSQVQWLLLVAVVPACATALRLVFAREQPNFAEMWVFSLYFVGQSLLFGVVLMLIDQLVTLPEPVLYFVLAGYFIATCLGYFSGPLPGRLLRTLLALLLAVALVSLFVAAVFYSAIGLAPMFA